MHPVYMGHYSATICSCLPQPGPVCQPCPPFALSHPRRSWPCSPDMTYLQNPSLLPGRGSSSPSLSLPGSTLIITRGLFSLPSCACLGLPASVRSHHGAGRMWSLHIILHVSPRSSSVTWPCPCCPPPPASSSSMSMRGGAPPGEGGRSLGTESGTSGACSPPPLGSP